jgi:tetraacyldisaccharide 4'-kinase
VREHDLMSLDADSLPAEVGDEPYLIYRATGFPVQVGSNRAAAVQSLLARGDVDVVISDDGLQHYRMARRVEVAVLDATRGLGNGWLLPSGPLRESRQRLAEVDVVLWNGTGEKANSDIAGVTFDLVPGPAVNLKTREHRALQSFSGQQVSALAGIGNPQRFYDLLKRFQLEPVPVASSDHGQIDLAAVLREGHPVLMTEKDAVKYSDTADANCWYVPVRAAFDGAAEQQLMHRICAKLKVA